MLDEAAQCLESNIREGVRDPRVYQRLAGVYRRQGRHELADEVLVEARRLAERMTRPPQQQGGRRAVAARPARPVPPPPPPAAGDVETAQLPATPVPLPMPPQPSSGGELELDWNGGDARGPGDASGDATAPVDRPWWVS